MILSVRAARWARATLAWTWALAAAMGAGGLTARWASAGEWVLPDAARGSKAAEILLLSRPDVRADLGLDPGRTEEAARLIADLRTRAAGLRGEPTPERIAARKALEEAQARWLEAKLAPAQRDRLRQIDLQWEGAAALTRRPALAESLGLAPSQRSGLAQAVVDRDARLARGLAPADCERTLDERSQAILDPAQHARWRAMLGRPLGAIAEPQP